LVPFTDVRHRGELIMQLSKDDPVVPDLCFRERGTRRSGSRAQQAIDPQFLNICKWQGKIVVSFDFVWFPSAKVFYLIFVGGSIQPSPETSSDTVVKECYETNVLTRIDGALAQYEQAGQLHFLDDATKRSLNDAGIEKWYKLNNYHYHDLAQIVSLLKDTPAEAIKLLKELKPPEDRTERQDHVQQVHNEVTLSIYGDACAAQVNSSMVANHGRFNLMPQQISVATKNDPQALKALMKEVHFTRQCDILSDAESTAGKCSRTLAQRLIRSLDAFDNTG